MGLQPYKDIPHTRRNALTGEWVLVSPHRAMRPWQGQQDAPDTTVMPAYDPQCYLCPGNLRTGGARNPHYSGVFVFDNDFQALKTPGSRTAQSPPRKNDDLFAARPETGICRVVCYSPRHDLTMARMQPAQAEAVITAWQQEYAALCSRQDIGYVQIFENRGAMMGCSNPHPHGQIWASSSVPHIAAQEDTMQRRHLQQHGGCLLCRYTALEEEYKERVVFSNDSFCAVVPYWAVWPFETMLLPRRHAADITDMTPAEKTDLAHALIRLTTRYDNLFRTPFPYSMGIHQQPCKGASPQAWHYHFHFYPPLLRSASVRKFMVGYEMLGSPQRDLTAESAADKLRALSDVHYTDLRQGSAT
ncbi:galactose-1-phosphate uridylyltransferase [Oleidesulfovibrio alaskensis G20]|jgi:UDPglucose--hexose-1-phosphate uridylyltransferase|uniref:Galactose-1-phosphate uridylyltransferase n=1 Tax=Oleidesulfovibrio alaskensis (strain ATCC BAA-1058 / DSM 17464 / G20) TaxID=207559 RepID=Q30V51_OLEA2|nr:UDP-glucose--hexose-1-phosphate uridylyltransferase [Oleidesulfovibrio alaskensis]ABB40445.1 galactose-1-phosphate uridylyltransferase [Oleidesulfovibrio alaskensis G20]MBG0772703.1 UDP-glucose--hexose-1-phosphate uridylyltransferase [Oleidesulfovibrio alaskensis]MBL3581866.1 UDP-glucose--hexose-1-phosphate uridylyltransferase [Oleidesulfovibrio alaskensis]